MAWPNIAIPSTITEINSRAQIRSDFEAGYVQSVAKYTRTRKIFELEWGAMTTADKQTLFTFFGDNIGDTFVWTSPTDDFAYTMMFQEDNIKAIHVPVDYWHVKLTLEEQ